MTDNNTSNGNETMTRFTLRTAGKFSYSAVTFTVLGNGNIAVDDMCGPIMVESVKQARARWADMVKRGWFQA